jgi:HAD superfamily hydrolase (TIGR01490 family)
VPADVLALFDLDHTLLPHDSDEQWVAFLLDRGLLDRGRYETANRELIDHFNRGEADLVEFTEFYLSTLVPFDAARLAELRRCYIEEFIRPRITERARAMVDRHRDSGDLVAITTAVFDFLAVPIAAEFGLDDVIATVAEFVDGRYTGRISGIANAREGKVERLHGWLAARGRRLADFRAVWAYCDSLNDLPLLSLASHPVAVNADPVLAAHARHRGWPIVQFA